MFVLIASYLLLVFVLPVALSALVSYRSLPCGRQCPQCGGDTMQLCARRFHLVNTVTPGMLLHCRWCLCCGWEGVSRVPREERQPAKPVDAPQLPRATTQTLDVRSLTVDGSAWRVMLQCWRKTGLVYGRLVFIGPSGRLWLDADQSFRGASAHEVLGQALSLPDLLLQNRLRRLVSG